MKNTIKRKKWNVHRIFSVIFASVFIFTQTQSVVFAQEREIKLQEMVITGTKSERLLTDVPVRTEIITAEDIWKKGAKSLYEALDGIPGIRVEQQCSFCNFSQVRMQGLESGHVAILIDGQPVYSGLAGVYGLQQVPASCIERIEVVKGAGSALYGSSAIAGVINIITKQIARDGDEESKFETVLTFGTNKTNTHTINGAGRLGKKGDIVISAQRDSGDAIDANNDKQTDRVWSDGFTGTFRINYYDVAGDDKLWVSGLSLKESRKGGDLTDDAYLNPFAEGSEAIETRRDDITLGYMKTFSNDNELTLQFTNTKHERDATNDTFVGDFLGINGVYPGSDKLLPYIANEKNSVAALSYAHPISDHRLMVGVQYGSNKLEEAGMYVRPSGAEYKSQSEKSADDIGCYLQDEWAISDKLELVAGARCDTHKSEDTFAGSASVGLEDVKIEYDESSLNPRVALMFKATPKVSLRASVGTGFRVPYNFSEDLHLCSGSPRVFKGTDLEPEKSISSTLSTDYIGEKFMVSASVFRTDLKKKIDIADAGATAAARGYDYEWENLGDAFTQGIELTGNYFFLSELSLAPYCTYTSAEYNDSRADWVGHPAHGDKYAEDSKKISRVPELAGGIGVSWTPSNWAFNVDADWTGELYIDYNKDDDVADPGSEIVKTDPFWVVNTKVEKSFPDLGLSMFVSVKNALDEVQVDKRPDDAAFMYKPFTGVEYFVGTRVAF